MPVQAIASRRRRSPATVRRYLRQDFRRILIEPPASLVPAGALVLLIDGLWSVLRGKCWVLYNLALKPVSSNTAWFLPPYLRVGRENVHGWKEAIGTIPQEYAERVKALVSDGIPGIDLLARADSWLLQRCHRHLLAALDYKLGHPRRQRTVQQPGRGIRAAIRESLITRDDGRVAALCDEIMRLSGHPNCTLKLRYTAHHFVRHQQAYRTYLLHPELMLPTTTSAVESMHNLLRQAISTANNPQATLLRAQAYLRLRPTVTCNRGILQQK